MYVNRHWLSSRSQPPLLCQCQASRQTPLSSVVESEKGERPPWRSSSSTDRTLRLAGHSVLHPSKQRKAMMEPASPAQRAGCQAAPSVLLRLALKGNNKYVYLRSTYGVLLLQKASDVMRQAAEMMELKFRFRGVHLGSWTKPTWTTFKLRLSRCLSCHSR